MMPSSYLLRHNQKYFVIPYKEHYTTSMLNVCGDESKPVRVLLRANNYSETVTGFSSAGLSQAGAATPSVTPPNE
jgi:hypothetical protein